MNNKILIQFSQNEITSVNLWKTIKPSIQSSMNFTIPDRTPEIFMADIDFENMIFRISIDVNMLKWGCRKTSVDHEDSP